MKTADPIESLRHLLKKSHQHELRRYHRAGELVLQLRPKAGHRDEKPFKLADAARELKVAVTLLYAVRDFASHYRRADLKRLSGLPWSQVRYLAVVPDWRIRRQLERRCRQQTAAAAGGTCDARTPAVADGRQVAGVPRAVVPAARKATGEVAQFASW
jgi:hypothetical protein